MKNTEFIIVLRVEGTHEYPSKVIDEYSFFLTGIWCFSFVTIVTVVTLSLQDASTLNLGPDDISIGSSKFSSTTSCARLPSNEEVELQKKAF